MKPGNRVLVIDDEVQIRNFLEMALTSEGYIFASAETGQAGLTKAISLRPAVIILDLALPDMSGREVLKSLRQWSSVPVIVLTVKQAEEEKVALLDAGADDYLTKPFSVPELLARVRAAIRRGTTPIEDGFKTGELEVNFQAHIVKVRNLEVKLTSTEFDLLKILVNNAGRVVQQKRLLSEVWGPNALENSHYLRIYIAQLRKKIEVNPALPKLLVTEPGIGYRLKNL